jgi:hypothetical protein
MFRGQLDAQASSCPELRQSSAKTSSIKSATNHHR